jgi:hypothetical protein
MLPCRPEWLRVPVTVFAIALPAVVSAQIPVAAVVHAGTLTISRAFSRPTMTIGAGAVEVNAAFDDGRFDAEACSPCAAGAAVGVGGRIAATGTGQRFYEGDFTITGAPLQIPQDAGADLVLTSAFTFSGRLIASNRRNATADDQERSDLEGGGIVTVTFTSTVDPETGTRLYFFQDAKYEFSPATR